MSTTDVTAVTLMLSAAPATASFTASGVLAPLSTSTLLLVLGAKPGIDTWTV